MPKSLHGMYGTPTYNSWQNMIQRCTNPKATGYKRWGGKGIKVCDRWRYSFENFYADMGERPEGKTIHRIELDGDYEPGNCKWATTQEQNRQQRLHKTNTSSYRGVHYDRGAWVTQISVDNRQMYLGRYETKEEAARTYNQAALTHFGAEAMLNTV
jgi:AP2 domain